MIGDVVIDPLPKPKLLAVSPEVADLVGLDRSLLSSDNFLQFFSGNMDAMTSSETGERFQSWATPYALSLYGEEMYRNCPFQNGNGYGDGRAVTIAEVLTPDTGRWELQLKGSGTTPFCRGGDGRAVLRSSLREFLASEAMHHLGVSTTRGLSLIVSEEETVHRPWFTAQKTQIYDTDPRIAHLPTEVRRAIVQEVNSQPDAMIEEYTANTCRVAPSFVRVGHIELFARRYRKALEGTDEAERRFRRVELRLIMEHLLFREFNGPEPTPADQPDAPDLQSRILLGLRESSNRIALLTAEWMRVGYCQGNFNSDNCLAGGRTMDFGPFGFIERYESNWNMWSGGGDKYSFRNQHMAGERNFFSLASSAALLLDAAGQEELTTSIIPGHMVRATRAVEDVYRQKMGLLEWSTRAAQVFDRLDQVMEAAALDYTIFWRQLADIVETSLIAAGGEEEGYSRNISSDLLSALSTAFYKDPTPELTAQLTETLEQWLSLVLDEVNARPGSTHTPASIAQRMRLVSPKYVPREWMLVGAYTAASKGDYDPLHTLQRLFEKPYDEQPEMAASFYKKTPADVMGKAGVATMT